MAYKKFELNLAELARDFFGINQDADQEMQLVMNESISFAATAIHYYQQLEAEAIAYLTSESSEDDDGEEDFSEEFDEEGPSQITAEELVNVVKLEQLTHKDQSLGRDISSALCYLFERQGQDIDWALLMAELESMDGTMPPLDEAK